MKRKMKKDDEMREIDVTTIVKLGGSEAGGALVTGACEAGAILP